MVDNTAASLVLSIFPPIAYFAFFTMFASLLIYSALYLSGKTIDKNMRLSLIFIPIFSAFLSMIASSTFLSPFHLPMLLPSLGNYTLSVDIGDYPFLVATELLSVIVFIAGILWGIWPSSVPSMLIEEKIGKTAFGVLRAFLIFMTIAFIIFFVQMLYILMFSVP